MNHENPAVRTPHVLVGRLVLGHTFPWRTGWVGSTGHYEDNTRGACQPVCGSDPTRISCGSGKVFEHLAGDASFEAAHHFVAAHPGQHDAV